MAKDFSNVNTGNIYNAAIAEATQEAPATQEDNKARKTYTAQEAEELKNALRTTGRKGVKLPRVNLAFSPEIYDYVRTMSKASGLTYTEFIHRILSDHKAAHEDIYKQAVKIRNSL